MINNDKYEKIIDDCRSYGLNERGISIILEKVKDEFFFDLVKKLNEKEKNYHKELEHYISFVKINVEKEGEEWVDKCIEQCEKEKKENIDDLIELKKVNYGELKEIDEYVKLNCKGYLVKVKSYYYVLFAIIYSMFNAFFYLFLDVYYPLAITIGAMISITVTGAAFLLGKDYRHKKNSMVNNLVQTERINIGLSKFMYKNFVYFLFLLFLLILFLYVFDYNIILVFVYCVVGISCGVFIFFLSYMGVEDEIFRDIFDEKKKLKEKNDDINDQMIREKKYNCKEHCLKELYNLKITRESIKNVINVFDGEIEKEYIFCINGFAEISEKSISEYILKWMTIRTEKRILSKIEKEKELLKEYYKYKDELNSTFMEKRRELIKNIQIKLNFDNELKGFIKEYL